MSNHPKGPRYLNRTVDAILQMKRGKTHVDISVKNIRRFTGVKGSNLSAVQFYSTVLVFLEREGVLRTINHSSPKKYVVIDEKKLQNFVEGC